ncbi:MAG: nucleoside monophosphate kinase, partial [Candidatus Pacebacteria bacterium]|nr:nucleoside monophosphate kinase [Candidatus Paceibacterota bacterium]
IADERIRKDIAMVKCNKPVVIIMGPPGSGKGTQALLLVDKFGLHYHETSKMIESHIMNAKMGAYEIVNGKKYPLADERKKWSTGLMCTTELINYWGEKIIADLAKNNQGIVFSGSPRTFSEAELMMPFLEKLYQKKNIKIIFLTLKPEDTMYRNSNRRICELMRHPILFNEDTKNLKTCPLDGSKLIERKGLDDPESIKVRLQVYKDTTMPVIDYLRKHKYFVKTVSAAPSPSVIFNNILKALDLK